MHYARVRLKQFVVFMRSNEDDLRLRVPALGGVQQDTGHGYVRSQGHPRENVDSICVDGELAAWACGPDTRPKLRSNELYSLSKETVVYMAEPGVEEVAQALDHDRKESTALLR